MRKAQVLYGDMLAGVLTETNDGEYTFHKVTDKWHKTNRTVGEKIKKWHKLNREVLPIFIIHN